MTGWLGVFILIIAAANPPTAPITIAWPRYDHDQWRCRVLLVCSATFALLLVLAILSGPILDALSVSVGSARLSAAVPLAFAGLRWLLLPARPITEEPMSRTVLAVLALTILFTPWLALTVVASAAKDGVLPVAVALAISTAAIAVLLILRQQPAALFGALARLLGGVAVGAAIAMGIDGTKTI